MSTIERWLDCRARAAVGEVVPLLLLLLLLLPFRDGDDGGDTPDVICAFAGARVLPLLPFGDGWLMFMDELDRARMPSPLLGAPDDIPSLK